MAGAQAQHSLGNRETPRIAAGIFPIGGASGQRMRRYFFGASPPGEGGGREQREKAGSNRKRQEQQEGAGNNAGAAMPEMPDNAARHANRQAGATCRTDDRRRAAGGTQQKAGSGRAAIRRAGGSIALKGRFHVHTNSDYRAPELTQADVEKILGIPKFLREEYEVGDMVGVVTQMSRRRNGRKLLKCGQSYEIKEGVLL